MKLLGTLALGTIALPIGAAEIDKLRGDRVGWARLKTQSEEWLRHASGDLTLTRFLRNQTTLNIDLPWYVADVQKLDEMRIYPLLFAQSLVPVIDAPGKANLAEYMRRGGFMLVDACCNLDINRDHDVFLQQHINYLKEILPEAKVILLPKDHSIYHCNFQIESGHPPHSYYRNLPDAKKGRHGLYGIMIGERMTGMISLCGLQCGWSPLGIVPPPGHVEACMKMMVNIYVYAMIQRG